MCIRDRCRVIENDSGLHFIIQFDTNLPDKTVEERLLKKGIKLQAITHFNPVSYTHLDVYKRQLTRYSGSRSEQTTM